MHAPSFSINHGVVIQITLFFCQWGNESSFHIRFAILRDSTTCRQTLSNSQSEARTNVFCMVKIDGFSSRPFLRRRNVNVWLRTAKSSTTEKPRPFWVLYTAGWLKIPFGQLVTIDLLGRSTALTLSRPLTWNSKSALVAKLINLSNAKILPA